MATAPRVTQSLDAAWRAADRVAAGIDLLGADPAARRAFGFANRAMAMQRVTTMVAAARRADPGRMSLLWFPTGGGRRDVV